MRSSRNFTRKLEELERARRMKDKAGLAYDIERGWCEAHMIEKLKFFVQSSDLERSPLAYFAAPNEETGWLTRRRLRNSAPAKIPHVFEDAGLSKGIEFAIEKERLRRLSDVKAQSKAQEGASIVSKTIKRRNSLHLEDAERERRISDLAEQQQARETACKISTSIKRRISISDEPITIGRRLSDFAKSNLVIGGSRQESTETRPRRNSCASQDVQRERSLSVTAEERAKNLSTQIQWQHFSNESKEIRKSKSAPQKLSMVAEESEKVTVRLNASGQSSISMLCVVPLE